MNEGGAEFPTKKPEQTSQDPQKPQDPLKNLVQKMEYGKGIEQSEGPLDKMLGRASLNQEYAKDLLRRPGLASEYIHDHKLLDAIREIRVDDLQDFARLALLGDQIVKLNPDLPIEEIQRRMREATQRLKEEKQNPPGK